METSDFGANIFDDSTRSLGDEPTDGKKAPRKRASRKKKSGRPAADDADRPSSDPLDPQPTAAAAPASVDPSPGAADDDLEIPRAWQPKSATPAASAEDGDHEATPDDPRGARKRRRRRSAGGEARESTRDPAYAAADIGAEPRGHSDEDVADFEPMIADAAAPRGHDDADFDGDDREDADEGDVGTAESTENEGARDADRPGRRRRRRRRGRRGETDRDETDRPESPPLSRAETQPAPVEQRRRPDDRGPLSPTREPRHSPGQAEGRPQSRHSRDDDDVRSGMPVRQPTRGPIDVPTADGEIHGSRLAILIDLEHVETAAQDRDREVAWGRLVAALGRRRHLIRCLAYAAPERARALGSRLAGNGIEVVATSDDDRAITVAVDAVNLSQRVDAVLLVPARNSFGPVARALAARGVRIESADFGSPTDAAAGWPHRSLGDECLFAP